MYSQIQINKKVYERVRKKTAETVRAQFAELEAKNGMKKSRSIGNLQTAGDEQDGDGTAAPSSRLSRLHIGTSLKKAIRATRDNIIGTSRTVTAGDNDDGMRETGQSSLTRGAAGTSGSDTSAVMSSNTTVQSHSNNSIDTPVHSTPTGNSNGSSTSSNVPARKSGMECIPS